MYHRDSVSSFFFCRDYLVPQTNYALALWTVMQLMLCSCSNGWSCSNGCKFCFTVKLNSPIVKNKIISRRFSRIQFMEHLCLVMYIWHLDHLWYLDFYFDTQFGWEIHVHMNVIFMKTKQCVSFSWFHSEFYFNMFMYTNPNWTSTSSTIYTAIEKTDRRQIPSENFLFRSE